MKHHIIVKFAEGTDVRALEKPVRSIFEQTLSIPCVRAVTARVANSDRPNRYGMRVGMDRDNDSLPACDVSEPHLRWKAEYAGIVAKKAIFDCDDECV